MKELQKQGLPNFLSSLLILCPMLTERNALWVPHNPMILEATSWPQIESPHELLVTRDREHWTTFRSSLLISIMIRNQEASCRWHER